MADGMNQARALRILEIIADYRTLQEHIRVHTSRASSQPPDAQSAGLMGYVVIRTCEAEARALLANVLNPGTVGGGQVDNNEATRVNLQRIILDASARRFQAQKIYLRVGAAVRWIAARAQVLKGQAPNSRNAAQLSAIDQRLQQEIMSFTDQHVFDVIRASDRNRQYWTAEDPSLAQILAWLRSQR